MTNLNRTIQRRSTATQITRGIALLLLLGGCYQLIYASVVAYTIGWGVQAHFVNFPNGLNHMGRALGLLVPGVALALLNRPLVKWIVPADRIECPKCSYELREMRAARCPECGYELFSEAASAAS